MKTTIAAALVTLCSPAAQAESFQLFSQGHWSVSYFAEGEMQSCVASVETQEIYFSLDVTHEGLAAWYLADDNNYGAAVQEGLVAVWIDSNVKWDTPAFAVENGVKMVGISKDFLKEIVSGRKLFIDKDYDGQWDAWFSLDGSAAAMIALANCSDKLGPEV